MDGGTGYKIGDALNIIGVGTHAPYAVGVVTVTNIYDNIGDTLDVRGVRPDSNSEFNSLYRITGVGTDNTIQVASASTIGAVTVTGVGVTDLSAASAHITGQALNVTNFNFNKVTGVGVVTTAQRHGLSVDNKVKLGGSDRSLYRGNFIIKKINDQNSFNVSIGIGTTCLLYTSPSPRD